MLRDDEGNPLQMYNTKSQAEIDRLKSIGLMDETYIPVNEMASRHYTAKSRYLNLNFGAKFKIIDGLNLELRYQTENTTGFTKQYDTKNALDVKTMINDAAVLNPNGTLKYNIPVGGQIVQTNTDNNSYTMRAQVNYNMTYKCLSAQNGGKSLPLKTVSTVWDTMIRHWCTAKSTRLT